MQQYFREFLCLFSACRLYCQVYFSICSHMVYVTGHFISCMQRLEYLVVIDEPLIFSVNNGFESQVCFLPDKQVHGISVTIYMGSLSVLSFVILFCFSILIAVRLVVILI